MKHVIFMYLGVTAENCWQCEDKTDGVLDPILQRQRLFIGHSVMAVNKIFRIIPVGSFKQRLYYDDTHYWHMHNIITINKDPNTNSGKVK